MPLIFSGETVESSDLNSVTVQAADSITGMPVVVRVSHHVIQDHGLPSAQGIAEAKYDSGRRESDGSIFVRDADFGGIS